MQIKPGVRITGLSNELLLLIQIIAHEFERIGVEPTITSIMDGRHSQKSAHWRGHGCDWRKWDVPYNQRADLNTRVRNRIGNLGDWIEEADHFHLEYDPRIGL